MRLRAWARAALLAPAATLVGGLGLASLGSLLVSSFWKWGGWTGFVKDFTLDNYRGIVRDPLYAILMLKSLWLAVLVTVSCLLIAYPVAYYIARKAGPSRNLFLVLVLIPFSTSMLIRNFTWVPMLGIQGVVNSALVGSGIVSQPSEMFLYNTFTVWLGFVHSFLPMTILPIFASLLALERTYLDAAADLGANKWQVLLKVTLPLSMPGVLSAAVLIYLNVLGAYVTPRLLGGPSGIMFGNLIADQMSQSFNLPLGAALSVVLLLVMVLTVVVPWAGTRLLVRGHRYA